MKSPKISDKNLYLNTVKRNLPMMLLFFVGLLIAIDISTILMVSRINTPGFLSYGISKREYVISLANGTGITVEFGSALCAIFAGCTVMRYLMNRKSAILFGSIPQKRTTQFFSSFFAGVTSFLLPLAVTVGIEFLILAVNGFSYAILSMTPYVLRGILWFFFFISLTCVIGMLCGMTSIQFLGVCTVLAYLPTVLVLLSGYISLLDYNIDIDYYMNMNTLGKLSPFIRLAYSISGNPLGVVEIILYSAASAILLATAAVLYLIRDNSKAGTPVVFDKVSSVIKYMLMTVCTAAFGLMFYGVSSGSLAWLFIGCVIGAVVSFMLMNVILFKNARAFFARPKGFAVFCGVFAVFMAVVALDPFGIKSFNPTMDNIKSVEMFFAGHNVTFNEEENIKSVYNIISGGEDIDLGGVYYDSCETETESRFIDGVMSEYQSVTVVSKLGIPYMIQRFSSDITEYKEEYLSLFESGEYKDKAFDSLKNSEILRGEVYTKTDVGVLNEYLSIDSGIDEIASAYLEESDGKIIHDDMGPIVITFSTYEGYSFPVYLEYKNTIEKLLYYNGYSLEGKCPTADTADEFLSNAESVRIVEGDKVTVITDKSQMAKIYAESVGFTGSYTDFWIYGDSTKYAEVTLKTGDEEIDYNGVYTLILKK